MSKTYVYLLILIGVYLIIVKGVKMSVGSNSDGRGGEHISTSDVTHGGGGNRREGTTGGGKRR